MLLTGVMTSIGRRCRVMAFLGQFRAQTPQPRQMDSSMTGLFFCLKTGLPETEGGVAPAISFSDTDPVFSLAMRLSERLSSGGGVSRMEMASIGHTFSHLPQETQSSALILGR